jgi:uncharacterized protein (DUF2141 family)
VLTGGSAIAASLDVEVTGVRSGLGNIRVAICDQPNFPSGLCPFRAEAPAHVDKVTVRLQEVRPGTYAASVFHDEAGTGKLEFTLLGTPKQGFGFSNDAKLRFGPPVFADAAFSLTEAGGKITLALRYTQ